MKRFVIVTLLTVGAFATNAQVNIKAKAPIKKDTAISKTKEEHCKTKALGKSCCKNEKAMNALSRSAVKSSTGTKKF